ncbi:hypothetical protein Pelo_13076 [Pelomyxa schiedti]|nr:hypothetical protein Pelo_13076 [Pelomyxa schiedti]
MASVGLSCAACHAQHNILRILSCKHRACKGCVEQATERHEEAHPNTGKMPKPRYQACPVCGAQTRSFHFAVSVAFRYGIGISMHTYEGYREMQLSELQDPATVADMVEFIEEHRGIASLEEFTPSNALMIEGGYLSADNHCIVSSTKRIPPTGQFASFHVDEHKSITLLKALKSCTLTRRDTAPWCMCPTLFIHS